MDYAAFAIIVTIVGGVIAIIGSMITIMLWVRSEASADRRNMENRQQAEKNNSDIIHQAIREEIHAIHMEMKDFHTRMCAIEERRASGKV